MGDCVRILVRARDLAPKGRRDVVIDANGRAALAWDDGVTTLEGQGFLPFDETSASVEDLFEAATLAEAEGDLKEAARLYDMSARADRKDAIALFNLGNVHLQAKAYDKAILAYARAVGRDPDFVEAHYNLAQACEAVRQYDRARAALVEVLARDARHADALFNLAQIELSGGDLAAAKARFEQYLAADPPSDWAEKARKAILYCTAKLSA
jgi:tetratricopeptide (TPR) repeat protein